MIGQCQDASHGFTPKPRYRKRGKTWTNQSQIYQRLHMVSTMRFASTTCHLLSPSLFEKGNQKENPGSPAALRIIITSEVIWKLLSSATIQELTLQCFSTWTVDTQYWNGLHTMAILFNDDFTNHLGYLCDYSWVVYFVYSQAMKNNNNKQTGSGSGSLSEAWA